MVINRVNYLRKHKFLFRARYLYYLGYGCTFESFNMLQLLDIVLCKYLGLKLWKEDYFF